MGFITRPSAQRCLFLILNELSPLVTVFSYITVFTVMCPAALMLVYTVRRGTCCRPQAVSLVSCTSSHEPGAGWGVGLQVGSWVFSFTVPGLHVLLVHQHTGGGS